ncbi:MAG: hypothetical protein ACOYOA_06510 [Saprospiraceae bacterium]
MAFTISKAKDNLNPVPCPFGLGVIKRKNNSLNETDCTFIKLLKYKAGPYSLLFFTICTPFSSSNVLKYTSFGAELISIAFQFIKKLGH